MIPPFPRATVEDVMSAGVIGCHADAPLVEVADLMATHRVHAVVVLGPADDEPGRSGVSGLVCDVDLVRAAAEHPEALTARAIARTEGVAVDPTTPLPEAARSMAAHGTAHLLVVRDGQPVGVLSGLDIAAAIAWGGGGMEQGTQ